MFSKRKQPGIIPSQSGQNALQRFNQPLTKSSWHMDISESNSGSRDQMDCKTDSIYHVCYYYTNNDKFVYLFICGSLHDVVIPQNTQVKMVR
jgi:hypothetical protein